MFLRDFTVQANIGIHAFERTGPQRLLISVELELDAADEPSQDDIGTVLDYDFLRREIHALVSGGHFNLQETLCREIIAIIARHDTVIAATVSTRKPDVYPDCAAVGVELVYRR